MAQPNVFPQDSTIVEQPEQTPEVKVTPEVTPDNAPKINVVDSEPEQTDTPTTIEIDGEKYTLDEIKEWRKGNMRQSDYTRKTQQLSQREKELADAVELFEYLKANPHIAQRLKDADENYQVDAKINQKVSKLSPEAQRLEQLELKIAQQELDNEIRRLTEKYPDFDEVKVLTESQKRGIYDLEFVYKATRENISTIDENKIRQQAIKEAKEQLLKELKANSESTQTVIGTNDTPPVVSTVNLTPAQQKVARSMGMTDEEYAEYMR